MDSGSTVTVIFEDWYRANIPTVPIQPISSLAIWGLSAESCPYHGYVVVEREFPEDVAGVKGPLNVLALVCPEPPQGHETPVVVGTNAFLFSRLFQLCRDSGSENKVSSMRIQAVYDKIQTQSLRSHAADDPIGQVKWHGPEPLTIAPGKKCYATCKVEQKRTKPQDVVLVEAPAMPQLPSGVLVQPGVLHESDMDENSFIVLLQNESEKPTAIQVGTVIAEMHAVDVVTDPKALESEASTVAPELFDFGDSPAPTEWKKRLQQKLAQRPLATYDFNIQYRPGRHNIDADLLSRQHTNDTEWTDVPQSAIKAICKKESIYKTTKSPVRLVDQLGVPTSVIPEAYVLPVSLKATLEDQLTPTDLQVAQDLDPVIGPVKQAIQTGKQLITSKNSPPDMSLLSRESRKLELRDKILYRQRKLANGTVHKQLVLPDRYRTSVMRSLHDECGHLGVEKTTEVLKDRFYWPCMNADVDQYIKTCGRCVSRKTLPQRSSQLSQITSNGPLDLVCIDFLQIEPDNKGVANVLVVIDHYTRYAQAFPTKDQKSVTVAKVLWQKYFVHYGLPARIHSDQGQDFESRLIKELFSMLGIRKSRTSPYHPQGDAQPERFNRTLLSMLGTLENVQKQNWSQHISQLVHAYNCSQNESTGYSPYYLMFGRNARLPIDICFGAVLEDDAEMTHLQYVDKMRRELKQAYYLATENATKNHLRNKSRYDQRVRDQPLQEGDRVLIRNVGLTGKHKLQDRWKSIPYIVITQLPNLPVYKVKPEQGSGGVKTLHRDHLLPICYLVRIADNSVSPERVRTPVTRRSHASRRQIRDQEDRLSDVLPDSESENEYVYKYPTITSDHIQRHEFRPNRPNTEPLPSDNSPSSESEPELEEGPSESSHEEECQPSNVEGDTSDTAADTEVELGTPTRPKTQKSKQEVKPVIWLTYDKPGTQSEEPVTIVHQGMVIQLNLSSTRGKNHHIKRAKHPRHYSEPKSKILR
ncbi:unnamed protein product [Oreochromis niloticus]|nr:unnamed protein product [Mustela putorius furo]